MWYDRIVGKLLAGLVLMAVVGGQSDAQVALREAAALERAGNASGALESYSWASEHSAAGSRDRAEALKGMASTKIDLGRYAEAVVHAREAAALFDKLDDPTGASTSLNWAGMAAADEGDYAQADRLIRSALELSTRTGDQPSRAQQLDNLASVQFYTGRYAEAARLYDEALAVTAASAAEPWAARRRRLVLANQATLYQRLGQDEKALVVYQELGAANRDLRPQEQAQVLVNLGVLYRRLGDPVKALTMYDKARELFARDRLVEGELNALKNRGIVLALDLKRLDEAERSFTEGLTNATAVNNRREMLHARLYRGETRLREGSDLARQDFDAALALARELKTPEEIWKALYGLGRVAPPPEGIKYLGDAVSTIEAIRENIRVPSLRSDFLNDKRDVYDTLLAARLADAPVADFFSLLERSHSRGWREKLGLTRPVDLGAVQQALPDGVLLLDYWDSPSGSAVVAVTRSRAAVVRIAVEPLKIKALIDSLASGPSATARALAEAVSPLLPPADWFTGIVHAIVVPDGAVALVPFDLLRAGDRPLIATAAVSYTPTAATLLRGPPAGRALRAPWRLEIRAFADPVFSGARLDDPAQLRGRLTASRDEVINIARELGGASELHVGAENRKAYLYNETRRAPILHLATHATANANAIEQSRLLFSPPAGGEGAADYLFLKEAYDLPLDGVDLAVLSACDTERGRMVRGEGVQSFSRAFLAAGARSTVTTLWRVADQPTADFMQAFYHFIQRGLSRDEALRRAKLRFMESGTELADPHYWAAFVLTGDALRPVPRAIAWTTIAAVSLMLIGSGIAGVQFRRRRRPAPTETI